MKTASEHNFVKAQYDTLFLKYDRMDLLQEFLGMKSLRKSLISKAKGKTLEIAAGAGRNFDHYSKEVKLTAIDFSHGMLSLAFNRARGKDIELVEMNANDLEFFGNEFDTVVSTLSLCTFEDPLQVLKEMRRVVKPNGQILLLEHGRSSVERIGNLQDRRVDKHAEMFGCIWNREPHDLVREAGLEIIEHERRFFGVFHILVLSPNK